MRSWLSSSEERLGDLEHDRRLAQEGGAAELGMDGGEERGMSSLPDPGSERVWGERERRLELGVRALWF